MQMKSRKISVIKLLRDEILQEQKCLNYKELDVKKSGEDLNENKTYNKTSDFQQFSHFRLVSKHELTKRLNGYLNLTVTKLV